MKSTNFKLLNFAHAKFRRSQSDLMSLGYWSEDGQWLPTDSVGDPAHDKETWQARLQDSRDSLGRSHPWESHTEETRWARHIRTRGHPRTCSSVYPQTRICLSYYLCLSPTLLTLTGGYPWPPFSGENQHRALLINLLGMKGVFQLKPPVSLLAYLTGLSRLLQCYWANACCQVPTSLSHCVPGSAYS